jgi:hypothetical protein
MVIVFVIEICRSEVFTLTKFMLHFGLVFIESANKLVNGPEPTFYSHYAKSLIGNEGGQVSVQSG